jgi:hypothetical protein
MSALISSCGLVLLPGYPFPASLFKVWRAVPFANRSLVPPHRRSQRAPIPSLAAPKERRHLSAGRPRQTAGGHPHSPVTKS